MTQSLHKYANAKYPKVKKNPAYGRCQLSRPMHIVAPIPRKPNKNLNRHRYTEVTLLKLRLKFEPFYSFPSLNIFVKKNKNWYIAWTVIAFELIPTLTAQSKHQLSSGWIASTNAWTAECGALVWTSPLLDQPSPEGRVSENNQIKLNILKNSKVNLAQ